MNINKLKLQELEKGKKSYDQIKVDSNINLESKHWKVIEKITYRLENYVPYCTLCNKMKSDLYYKDFLHHIRKIYRYSSSTTIEKTLEKLENET